jgi:hypothetical protein
MWLVHRTKPLVCHGAAVLSDGETAALKTVYAGQGSVEQKRIAARLLQRARGQEQWIACDCQSRETVPLLAPAYLTDGEVYYLRRLTGPGRVSHAQGCVFQLDPVDVSGVGATGAEYHAVRAPTGYFAVLPSREHGRAADGESESAEANGREPGSGVPRLARQLWRLLEAARRNEVPPVGTRAAGLREEFKAMKEAAERIEIAKGITLDSLHASITVVAIPTCFPTVRLPMPTRRAAVPLWLSRRQGFAVRAIVRHCAFRPS